MPKPNPLEFFQAPNFAALEESIRLGDETHRRWLAEKAARASAVRADATAPAWPTPPARTLSPLERHAYAVHEAGHCVIAHLLFGPDCLNGVQLDPEPVADITDPVFASFKDRVTVSAAGGQAQLMFMAGMPDFFNLGQALTDLDAERGRTEKLLGTRITEAEWSEAQMRAADLLPRVGDAVEAVTHALLVKGTLTRQDLLDILGA